MGLYQNSIEDESYLNLQEELSAKPYVLSSMLACLLPLGFMDVSPDWTQPFLLFEPDCFPHFCISPNLESICYSIISLAAEIASSVAPPFRTATSCSSLREARSVSSGLLWHCSLLHLSRCRPLTIRGLVHHAIR